MKFGISKISKEALQDRFGYEEDYPVLEMTSEWGDHCVKIAGLAAEDMVDDPSAVIRIENQPGAVFKADEAELEIRVTGRKEIETLIATLRVLAEALDLFNLENSHG